MGMYEERSRWREEGRRGKVRNGQPSNSSANLAARRALPATLAWEKDDSRPLLLIWCFVSARLLAFRCVPRGVYFVELRPLGHRHIRVTWLSAGDLDVFCTCLYSSESEGVADYLPDNLCNF